MSFLTAASDRSSSGLSGRVSGPSFSGISSFCGVSSVLLAMSLHPAEPAPEITKFHQPQGFKKARPSGGVGNPAAGVFSNGTVGLAAVVLSLFIVSFSVGGVLLAGGAGVSTFHMA